MKRTLLVALLLPLSLSLACKKQAAPASMMDASGPAAVKSAPVEAAMEQIRENFSRVHFGYDSSSLDAQSRALLQANAAIMAKHPEIAVEIQGHCDERGTTDYNLALGERRAVAVKSQMQALGVAPSRVKTVSYGEERPLRTGAGETVWSENRRAEFRVYAGESVALGTVQ